MSPRRSTTRRPATRRPELISLEGRFPVNTLIIGAGLAAAVPAQRSQAAPPEWAGPQVTSDKGALTRSAIASIVRPSGSERSHTVDVRTIGRAHKGALSTTASRHRGASNAGVALELPLKGLRAHVQLTGRASGGSVRAQAHHARPQISPPKIGTPAPLVGAIAAPPPAIASPPALQQAVPILPAGAPVGTTPASSATGAAASGPIGIVHAAATDTPSFFGTSPAVVGSKGALTLDIPNKKVSWSSDDTKIGKVDSGGLVANATWMATGANPQRVVFTVNLGLVGTLSGNILLDPTNSGWVEVTKGGQTVKYLVQAAQIKMTISQPNFSNLNETPIADKDKLSIGSETWVNNDNNDKDGQFDINDNNVAGGDPDLIKLDLTIGPIGANKGTATLDSMGGAANIKVWTSSSKVTQYNLGAPLNVPADFTAGPTGLTKTLWIEGIEPSDVPQETLLKFTYDQTPALSDQASVTVLGITSLDWLGRSNGFTAASTSMDNNTLDADPNFPAKNIAGGVPGSNRVFPDARAPNFSTARDKVDLQVSLNVEPVEPVKVYVKSFDEDDPSSNVAPIDPNDTGAAGNYYGTGAGGVAALTFTANEDNRGSVGGNKAGMFTGQDASAIKTLTFGTTDLSQKAEFTVSEFAGDNYVAVASGSPEFLKQLRNLDQKDAFRVVDPNVGDGAAGQIPDMITNQGGYISNDLTVWRLVHIEEDSMQAPTPTADDAEGRIESITGAGKTVTIVGGLASLTVNGVGAANLNDGSVGNGRFENGLIASVAKAATAFKIASDNHNLTFTMTDAVTIPYTITNKNGTVTKMGNITGMSFAGTESTLTVDGLTAGDNFVDGSIQIGDTLYSVKSINAAATTLVTKTKVTVLFDAYDDDLNADGTNKAGLARFPDTSLMAPSFNPVDMFPVIDGGGDLANDTKDVPFLANIPADNDAAVAATFKIGSAANEKNTFWIVYLLAAFQHTTNEDNDPNNEAGTGGIVATPGGGTTLSTTMVVRGAQGTDVYLETDRDRVAAGATAGLEQRVVVHETGHQFGLAHNTGIMTASLQTIPAGGFVFSNNDQALLRDRIKSPGQP
jgi:hypothetical protein